VGFFCFGQSAQVPEGHATGTYADPRALDVGLGLRPDLTGCGLGLSFVLAGLDIALATFHPSQFRMSVDTFNRRAIAVYERAGFVMRHHGENIPFVVMPLIQTDKATRT
jgi:RimJ/RimL family protein N-acetyltransferase